MTVIANMQRWLEDLLTRAWGPSLPVAIITTIIVIALPILIHYSLYRARTPNTLPSFLVVGPSGAGKTSLVSVVSSLTTGK